MEGSAWTMEDTPLLQSTRPTTGSNISLNNGNNIISNGSGNGSGNGNGIGNGGVRSSSASAAAAAAAATADAYSLFRDEEMQHTGKGMGRSGAPSFSPNRADLRSFPSRPQHRSAQRFSGRKMLRTAWLAVFMAAFYAAHAAVMVTVLALSSAWTGTSGGDGASHDDRGGEPTLSRVSLHCFISWGESTAYLLSLVYALLLRRMHERHRRQGYLRFHRSMRRWFRSPERVTAMGCCLTLSLMQAEASLGQRLAGAAVALIVLQDATCALLAGIYAYYVFQENIRGSPPDAIQLLHSALRASSAPQSVAADVGGDAIPMGDPVRFADGAGDADGPLGPGPPTSGGAAAFGSYAAASQTAWSNDFGVIMEGSGGGDFGRRWRWRRQPRPGRGRAAGNPKGPGLDDREGANLLYDVAIWQQDTISNLGQELLRLQSTIDALKSAQRSYESRAGYLGGRVSRGDTAGPANTPADGCVDQLPQSTTITIGATGASVDETGDAGQPAASGSSDRLRVEHEMLLADLRGARRHVAERDAEVAKLRVVEAAHVSENSRLRAMMHEWSTRCAKLEQKLLEAQQQQLEQ